MMGQPKAYTGAHSRDEESHYFCVFIGNKVAKAARGVAWALPEDPALPLAQHTTPESLAGYPSLQQHLPEGCTPA